jgi:hypothetical protein
MLLLLVLLALPAKFEVVISLRKDSNLHAAGRNAIQKLPV